MLKNACITLYRISVRHPLYAAINLLGLSFGIATFLVLALYVRFETSFEGWIPGASQIYQVGAQWSLPGRPASLVLATMGGLLDEIREDYPDVIGTRLWNRQISLRLGDSLVREQEALVDQSFFKTFDIDLVAGDKVTALSAPDNIMMTEKMAEKYFGATNAIGKTVSLVDFEGSHSYVVSAIIKNIPQNSDFNFDFVRLLSSQVENVIPYWKSWTTGFLFTYLHLPNTAEARSLEDGFDAFIGRKLGGEAQAARIKAVLRLRLIQLSQVHLRDRRSYGAVMTLGLVGLLSFLVAAINFVNLATARAGLRAREVAVRRCLGATKAHLRWQFLAEAVITTMVATLIALSLVELVLPLINAAGNLTLSLNYVADAFFLMIVILSVLFCGLLAGVYPAIVLSGFAPAQVLAASRTPGGGRLGIRVREALVVFQFAVVITFFILTWGFNQQIRHLQLSDLGFQRENLLLVPSTRDSAVNAGVLGNVLAALRSVPGVTGVTSATSAPGDDSYNTTENITVPGMDKNVTLESVEVGTDFFSVFGAKLVAGRFLDAAHPADLTPDHADPVIMNIVIDANAVQALGFPSPTDAVGKLVFFHQQPRQIVGVVENLRFHSDKSERAAIFYFSKANPGANQIAALRFSGVGEAEMRGRVAAAWRTVAANVPLEMASANDNLGAYYQSEQDRLHLVEFGAIAAGLVGCVGLYGMVAFNVSRRLQEIAIRKVVGAPRHRIVWLLVGQFLRPVLIANAFAGPVAYLVLARWLTQFNDPIALTPVAFLVAGAGALAMAAATVGGQAFAASNLVPGQALRTL